MNCYIHPETVAVGSCKHCYKGVCASCSIDSGLGLACCTQCEAQIHKLQAMLNRSSKLHKLGVRTHFRNAIWLALMAGVFTFFGIIGGRNIFLLGMGAMMLLGALFSWLTGSRLRKFNAEVNAS